MSRKSNIPRFLNRANSSIKSNDYKDARYYFDKVLAIDSYNEEAIVGKAYCIYHLGDEDFARKLCSMVSKSNLNNVTLNYYNKIVGNNFDAPVKQFKSREIEELFKKAGYSINRWEYNQAIIYLDKILNFDFDADAIVCKAYCYYKLEDFSNAYYFLDKINKSMLTGNYFKYYDELISVNDNTSFNEDIDVLLLKGFKKLSQLDYSIANTYFDKALKFDSNNSNALVGQSFCYYKFGNYSRAKELYSKINKEKLSELSNKYYSILSDKYCEIHVQNDDLEGKKCCPECGRIVNDYAMRCVKCNHYFEDNYLSDDKKSFLKKSSCENAFKLVNKKEFKRALLRFNKILKYDSEDVLAIFGKAICYQNLGKHNEALELCNQASDIFGDIKNQDIFNSLVSEINESISLESKNKKCPSCGKQILKDSIWCIYCNYYFKEKDQEYYLKQNKLDMYLLHNSRNRYSSLDDYVNILHWGYEYSLRRNLDDAMICINQILEFYPHNPNYLYDKAIVFYKKEKYDETLMLIEQVRNIDKSIVNDEWYIDIYKLGKEDLFKNLIKNAKKASLEEDFKSALSYYNQALIFEPHNIYVLNNKAHTLLYLQNYDEAIKIFDEVLEIDFEYIDALLGKSHALYYSNKYKDALVCFNKIIEIFDGFIDYEFYNDLFEKAENE